MKLKKIADFYIDVLKFTVKRSFKFLRIEGYFPEDNFMPMIKGKIMFKNNKEKFFMFSTAKINVWRLDLISITAKELDKIIKTMYNKGKYYD